MKTATERQMALAARLHRRDPAALEVLREQLPEGATPGAIEGLATAFRDWFSHGLHLTVFRTVDDAVALAETEPPSWYVQFPTGGGQWVLAVQGSVDFGAERADPA